MAITKEQIDTIIREEYNRIWIRWYPSGSNVKQAELKIEIGDMTTYYRPSEDCIHIYVPEGNFEDFEAQLKDRKYFIGKLGWYIHQTELVHEMLHEYQHKVIQAPSDAGKALFAKHGQTFDGPGHDEKFFTAVAEKASFFGLSPDEFLKEL